jgi:hypothetical protein
VTGILLERKRVVACLSMIFNFIEGDVGVGKWTADVTHDHIDPFSCEGASPILIESHQHLVR